jgi:prepilin-type N-terminal cleavage/methylation domain-containing protein
MRFDIVKINKKQSGFTLIEALIAMVLLGVAITALVVANRSFSTANATGLEMSTAEFLTEQVREQTITTPFASLMTNFNNKTYSPPHDSRGNSLSAYAGYSQKITVQNESGFGPSTEFYRITVEIRLNNEVISSASWLRANY